MKTVYYKMPVINNTLFLFIALVTEGCGIVLRNPAQVSCQLECHQFLRNRVNGLNWGIMS